MNNDEKMTPECIAYLNQIQGTINRMAGNSASAKNWCILTMVPTLALKENLILTNLFYGLILCLFMSMDAYYLRFERMYRNIFNKSVSSWKEDKNIDLFQMNPFLGKDENTCWCRVFFSCTELGFYISIFCIFAAIKFLMAWKNINLPQPNLESLF